MKDSPNGKRYGKRDPKGRIVEAYGFDLSPIAARHAEFVRLAEEGRAERAAMGRLRRRATIAQEGDHPDPRDGRRVRLRGRGMADAGPRERGPGARAEGRGAARTRWRSGSTSLERRQTQARERLEILLRMWWIPTPRGRKTSPTYTTTNQALDPQEDTVIAAKECSGEGEGSVPNPKHRGSGNGRRRAWCTGSRRTSWCGSHRS